MLCLLYGLTTIKFTDGIQLKWGQFIGLFFFILFMYSYFIYLNNKVNISLFEEIVSRVESQKQF